VLSVVGRSGSVGRMFLIELSYKVDLAKIDAHMAAHVRYLKKHYASGTFVASGRKIPRDGGVILAVGDSREEIERIVNEDPFCSHRLADFRIIEFRVSQRAADLNPLFVQSRK
jgi:uncharacterized protein YciI